MLTANNNTRDVSANTKFKDMETFCCVNKYTGEIDSLYIQTNLSKVYNDGNSYIHFICVDNDFGISLVRFPENVKLFDHFNMDICSFKLVDEDTIYPDKITFDLL